MGLFRELYRTFFGKDYSVVWKQFAIERKGSYSAIPDDKVQLSYKGFTLTIDAHTHYVSSGGNTYESYFLRGMVEFLPLGEYTLQLTQQGFFENVGKLFGMQDIRIGVSEVDRKFIIKSNDEVKTQLLFSDRKLTNIFETMKVLRIQVSDKTGLCDEKTSRRKFYVVCCAKRFC